MSNEQLPEIKETPKFPKVFIWTFGCQMNEHDSAKLYKILESSYSKAESAKEADLVIINTCSVREKPEQKLYSALGEMRRIKKVNPELLIGVGGCVAQQEGEAILKRNNSVDFVFGTHNLSLVPSLIKCRKEGLGPQVAVSYREEWEELPLGFTGNDRIAVFISISRGCNKNCTYCIVPRTRGREVSRDPLEIEREVRIAVHRGAKEVTLLGQTVNSYGRDLKPRCSFLEILDRLSKIEGLERIRFTSPHPQEVHEDFIGYVSSNSKIAKHIHMPLQSGSDRILKLMNRNYRQEKYLEIIKALKRQNPDIAITTDLIVGFPGEAVSDFEETLAVMKEVQFDSSFSFMFSPRPGTKAALMKDQVPHEEKLERLYLLQAKQEEITARRLGSWIGKEVQVLLDAQSSFSPEILQGRLSQNIVINLDKRYSNIKLGDIIDIEVTDAGKHTLKGRIKIGKTINEMDLVNS